jgi:hypothetical protein
MIKGSSDQTLSIPLNSTSEIVTNNVDEEMGKPYYCFA